MTVSINPAKYITSKYWDGKHPHIIGRRIRVAYIVREIQDKGKTVPVLAKTLRLSEDAIHAALMYYEQHRDEIDIYARDEDDDDFRNQLYDH